MISSVSRFSSIATLVAVMTIMNGCKSSGSKLQTAADATHPSNQLQITADKENVVAILMDKTAADLWDHLAYLGSFPTSVRSISSYDKAVTLKCANRNDCKVTVAYNLADPQGNSGKTMLWENDGRLVVQWSDGSAQNLYNGMANQVFKNRDETSASGIIALANGGSEFAFRCSWLLKNGSHLDDADGRSYSCGVYMSLATLNDSNTAAAVAVDASKAGVVKANLTGIDASRLWSKFQVAKQPDNLIQAGPISLKCSSSAQLTRTCTLSVAMQQEAKAEPVVAAVGSVVERTISGTDAQQFMKLMTTAPGTMIIDPKARAASTPDPTAVFALDSTDRKVKIFCSRNGIDSADGKTKAVNGCTVRIKI